MTDDVKVEIDCDEKYPFYTYDEDYYEPSDQSKRCYYHIVLIPREKLEWIKKVTAECNKAQEYLEKRYEESWA